VYNETIRDLLVEPDTAAALDMREDPEKGIVISGLTSMNPSTAEEVLELLSLGNSRRTQSPTDANLTSSRSHAVFQVLLSPSLLVGSF